MLSFDTNHGYGQMAARMVELASRQPDFLGVESAREDIGVTVSCWSDLKSIERWKENMDHQEGQRKGRAQWYSSLRVRVAKVEGDYSCDKS